MAPSTESKNGSPTPMGRPVTRHSMTPPTLSPARRATSISLSIRVAASASGQPTSLRCARSRSVGRSSLSGTDASTAPIDRVKARKSTPLPRHSSRPMDPATTSPTVIRPEKIPPPRRSASGP